MTPKGFMCWISIVRNSGPMSRAKETVGGGIIILASLGKVRYGPKKVDFQESIEDRIVDVDIPVPGVRRRLGSGIFCHLVTAHAVRLYSDVVCGFHGLAVVHRHAGKRIR